MSNNIKRWIFFIVYLGYTSIYIARVNLSMAGPALEELNVISTVRLGMMGGWFSTIYAAGRLVNGALSDRTPPWFMMTLGLGLSGISNLFIGLFPPFIAIFLCWIVNAYAQSMLWGSVLCVISSIYDEETAKKKSSLMVTSVAMGNIVGIVLNTYFITHFGVRFAFILPGAMTVILGTAVFLSTRGLTVNREERRAHLPVWALLKNREMLLLLLPVLFHGVMKENVTLWMTVYTVDTYKVDIRTLSWYILLIPLVGFAGRMAYPLLYRLCRENEHAVSFVGFVLCLLAAALLFFGHIGMVMAVTCLSLIYAAVSLINTSVLSIYPLRYHATGNVASVSGLMDFSTYLGGGITGILYGILIKAFGYQVMFLSWLIISVVSLGFTWALAKRTFHEAKSV